MPSHDQIESFADFIKSEQWPIAFLTSSKFQRLIDVFPVGVIISNQAGQILQTNDQARRIFKYSKAEFSKLKIEDLIPENIRKKHVLDRAHFFEFPRSRFMDNYNAFLSAVNKDKQTISTQLGLFCINSDKGPLAVNLIIDTKHQQQAQKSIEKMAFIDPVTNLPNRHYLEDALPKILSKAKRCNETVHLLFIDLDKFKPINDNYGHHFGDIVLKTLATRYATSLRESDFIARFGGDEFILVAYPSTNNDVKQIAERLLIGSREVIKYKALNASIAASIGIASTTENGYDQKALISAADKRMYLAKKAGGDQVSF